MEQFSLAEYLKNPTRPIVTRDGRSVRIICTDRNHKELPIVALVLIDGEERVCSYMEDGKYLSYTHSRDLFFAPEPKTKKGRLDERLQVWRQSTLLSRGWCYPPDT